MNKILAIQSCDKANKLIQTALQNNFELIWAQDEKQIFEILKNQTNICTIIILDPEKNYLNLNPLTKLPGNELIKKVIQITTIIRADKYE